MPRAIGLVSGGLDSVLAVRLLLEQGIECLGVCFVSPFFGARKAKAAAKLLGIPLEVVDFSDAHLDLVKAPPHGYGKNMNPCIDCHAMMLRYAGRMMEERGFDFLFTGEVLGERPMSQNRNALRQVAKLSGYRDSILRPLSALVLEPTAMERSGAVDRSRLADISGRSRKPQMDMAARLGISTYEPPAGGCLLTDPAYGRRLKQLFERIPDCGCAAARLLTVGRLFWVAPGAMVLVGRRQGENERLTSMAAPGDALLHVDGDIPGPTVLVTGQFGEDEILKAAGLTVRYSDVRDQGPRSVAVLQNGVRRLVTADRPAEEDIETWRGAA